MTERQVRFLVTGAVGQVGWELCRVLPALGHVVALDREKLDLTKLDEVKRVLREVQPDVLINAAAYTSVDAAEREPEAAWVVNAVAPRVLAEEQRRAAGLLVHYSTDYVFDGTLHRPYVEDDVPSPLSVYGASKLAGERAIQAVGGEHLIFRTSWVYGGRGRNFLLTMLKLFEERSEVKVVDDQIGAPTWCRWLAESTASVLAQCIRGGARASLSGRSGIYHMTPAQSTSWFGFASAILDAVMADAGTKRPTLIPIPTSGYPLPARRPGNSVLSGAKLQAEFGIDQPPWDALLRRCMAELAPARCADRLT